LIDAKLLDLVRCPRCIAKALAEGRGDNSELGRIALQGNNYVCQNCGTAYDSFASSPTLDDDEQTPIPLDDVNLLPRRGYLDLLPRDVFEQNTRYLEEEFEHEIDYEHISLPLLGAAVRNDLLRKLLKPGPNDLALEVGCGNGRFCFWNRQLFGTVVGVDAAPLFAEEALNEVALVRGDGRLLPFASGSFDKLFSIDLLEHLPLDGIAPFFAELNRVTKKDGLVFIFSNTREMGRLSPIIKLERKIANFFTKRGVFDFKRDELRKSDHIKAIRTFEELEAAIRVGGFHLEKKVFWNGVFQGLVDNIIVKAGEYFMRERVRRRLARQAQQRQKSGDNVKSRLSSGTTGLTTDWADGGGSRTQLNAQAENRSLVEREAEKVASEAEENATIDLAIRKTLKRNLAKKRGGLYLVSLRIFTWLMRLDIILFGRLRTGPYFIVIRKVALPANK